MRFETANTQLKGLMSCRDQPGERVILVAHELIRFPGKTVKSGLAGKTVQKFYEFAWIFHCKTSQHQSVDEAKYGGVGADAQGENEDGYGGEARRFSQRPHSVTQILN